MKIELISENKTYYKANLHCHTVISDGNKTPEEIKRDYMAHGYSVVAFTDHDKYIPHNELTDKDFVALNGFELEYNKDGWKGVNAHFCFVAERPDIKAFGFSDPGFNPFLPELAPGEKPLSKGGRLYSVCPCERSFAPSYINGDIRQAKKLGFFVTYNHPTWSMETYPDYSGYRGFDAMEILNYCSITQGYDDDDGRVYSDILRTGKTIGCIATDDNHNAYPDGKPYCDSYGGWTMIGADSLSYEDVIKALRDGSYYACGSINPGAPAPAAIRSLWLEDGRVHIKTDPVRNIMFMTDIRKCQIASAGEELIDEASFDPGLAGWFRIVCLNEGGNKTYTRAYFMDGIYK